MPGGREREVWSDEHVSGVIQSRDLRRRRWKNGRHPISHKELSQLRQLKRDDVERVAGLCGGDERWADTCYVHVSHYHVCRRFRTLSVPSVQNPDVLLGFTTPKIRCTRWNRQCVTAHGTQRLEPAGKYVVVPSISGGG